MKVKKLIQELSKLNPNTTVFIASDAEGNSYSQVDEVDTENGNLAFGGYPHSDDVVFGVLKDDGSGDEVFKKPAAILYPV